MKNPFISEEFLKKEVTITPEQLGDAISRAVHKEIDEMPSGLPSEFKEKMAHIYLKFGATVMTELLYCDLGLDPDKFSVEENKEGDKNVTDKT